MYAPEIDVDHTITRLRIAYVRTLLKFFDHTYPLNHCKTNKCLSCKTDIILSIHIDERIPSLGRLDRCRTLTSIIMLVNDAEVELYARDDMFLHVDSITKSLPVDGLRMSFLPGEPASQVLSERLRLDGFVCEGSF